MLLTAKWTADALQQEEAGQPEGGCGTIGQTQLHVHRDFFLILCVSIGIYSHNSALVGHYLLNKKTIRQQKQLTQVFHEQPEGLIVLQLKKDENGVQQQDQSTSSQKEQSIQSLDNSNR